MIQSVRKRDGRVAEFDPERIRTAIAKALREVGQEDPGRASAVAHTVVSTLEARYAGLFGPPHVEEIQDIVEEALMAAELADAARAYIVYRHQHKQLRELKELIDPTLVEQYLNGADWRVKENSNMSFSLQGLNVFLTDKLIARYWLDRIYPSTVRKAHEQGDLHIHDLGTLGPYCVGWDLHDLLTVGFRGVRGKVEARPAKHFRVALLQAANFLYTLQGEAAGAQAFSGLDTYLAPFVARDQLGYPQIKQAIQEFVYNLNVPTRVGFQTPFTNTTLDLKVPKDLENTPAAVGGRHFGTYGDFQEEMDLINRALAEVLGEGDARGRVFTFPIPTYNIVRGFEWDNDNLQPLWEMTARYGIPYFANFINSDMQPEDARSMCCRLRLDTRELKRRGGGLFGSNPLTGSIGVVTVNLPRLALQARDEQEFVERLADVMDLARQSLAIKRKALERLTEQGLYPYSNFYLRAVHQATGAYWANHFSTIGVIGMNEACVNLLGCTVADPQGVAFAARILDYMRQRLADYQDETGQLWNLEATPAEGASHRLALLDQQRFPRMAFGEAGSHNHGRAAYYTNSSQLPVGFTDDLFHALKLQEPLQTRYTGGTVFHAWLGERLPNPESAKQLVRKTLENFRTPYLTLTPTFSICPSHGYLGGEHSQCPQCGTPAEIYSRVVGYLRPVEQWNAGKQREFADRRTFDPTEIPVT